MMSEERRKFTQPEQLVFQTAVYVEWEKVLQQNGIPYTVKNAGQHFIVEGKEGYIDFWPGSGKWISRKDGKRGFGLRELIPYILS